MTIRKTIVAGGFALLLGMGTASAAPLPETIAPNAGKYSLGYQGVIGGSMLDGMSSRYWINNKVGTELNLFLGKGAFREHSRDVTGNLVIATAKVMYAPVVKTYSRFYVGLEGGIGGGNTSDTSPSIDPLNNNEAGYVINPLMGTEFNFSEIPELGFNFEVGYKTHIINANGINVGFTSVSLGAHYYF